MLKYYVYLNPGLSIVFNGEKFKSVNGLKDLLEDNNELDKLLYPIIHLKGNDIEIALTHSKVSIVKNIFRLLTDSTQLREELINLLLENLLLKPFENFLENLMMQVT